MSAEARPPSAWVFNLDAELELATGARTPDAKVLARIPELTASLRPLLAPGDVVVDRAGAALAPGLYVGRAWCPTPSAIERLRDAGASPVPSPDVAVLRRVNHRRFAADLGQMLEGARYVDRLEDLCAAIEGESATGHWLLKRPFGFAGRGRRRVARGSLDPSARPWVLASLAKGEGLQVEPWALRLGDFALHGHVARGGAVVLGEPSRNVCDASGAWVESTRDADLEASERRALVASAELAGAALAAAGYFGPFGVDAFRYRAARGTAFNPRSEINARYSMGWAVGMGNVRPDLDLLPEVV